MFNIWNLDNDEEDNLLTQDDLRVLDLKKYLMLLLTKPSKMTKKVDQISLFLRSCHGHNHNNSSR